MILSKVRSSFLRLNSVSFLALPERFVQGSKHVLVLSAGARPRALHSSTNFTHSVLSLSSGSTQTVPQTTIAAVGLAVLGFGTYQWIGKEAQALEVDEPHQWGYPEKAADIRRITSWQPYSMEDVEYYLRAGERTVLPPMERLDFLRADCVQVHSNWPMEDSISPFMACGGKSGVGWLAFGIYDGHSGVETASALQTFLIPYVLGEMVDLQHSLYPNASSEVASVMGDLQPDQIDMAIKSSFLGLDRLIVEGGAKAIVENRYLNDAMSELAPSYAGSCALLCLYQQKNQTLRVACTGDSRAVLGRRNAAGDWEAVALSTDQTGFNESEVARLYDEHPGEKDIIKDGRLLGLAVTRAFGDGLWKWPKEVAEEARQRLFGRPPRPGSISPPYLTAEPVITTTKISPQNGDFLVMATDGLWDNLSSEEAVGLVALWLEQNGMASVAPPLPPADLAVQDSRERAWVEREATRRRGPKSKNAYTESIYGQDKHFVVKDKNVATHLARNALGGGDEDVLRGRLTVPPPFARNLRDDITVEVIFFGESKDNTGVTGEQTAAQAFDLETY